MGKPGSSLIFLYAGTDLDHSQNLVGSKLEPSYEFCQEDPISNICLILLLTNKQTEYLLGRDN